MVIRASRNILPRAAASARAAETAVLIGNVTLGENVSVWYGSVLRGDVSPIVVGDGTNIQDNCVLHGATDLPTILGKNVVIGHSATVHGCTVEDGCLIGMGAVLLDGCSVGEGSVIGAGAVVPPGKAIPPGSTVMGVPGKVVREVSEEEVRSTLENASHYVRLGREQLEAYKP